MPRYRQVWNEKKGKHELVEISSAGKTLRSHYVQEDIKPVVSPIDGTVIGGRKQQRDHCKRHNVILASEVDQAHMDAARKKREDHYNGVRTKAEIQRTREHFNEVINQMERNNGRR